MQVKLLIFLDEVYSTTKSMDVKTIMTPSPLMLSDLKTLKDTPLIDKSEIIFKDDKMYKLKSNPDQCQVTLEQENYVARVYYESFTDSSIYSESISRFDFYFLNILLYLRKDHGLGDSTIRLAKSEAKEIMNRLKYGQ